MTKKTQAITPRKFVKIYEKNKNSIQSVKIIPPKLGEKGFGKIEIKRKTSTYKKPSLD